MNSDHLEIVNKAELLGVIITLYIRSVVWHSSLTRENCDDLEQVQKCAVRIILMENCQDYDSN